VKFSPSTADVSILRKGAENVKLLRTHVRGRYAPVQFSSMFDQLEEYDTRLHEQTGRRLRQAQVFEIGYGARPWRLIALVSMGIDASGVDVEVPLLSGGWREVLEAFRRNGSQRALKSLVRHMLVDKRERSVLAQELQQRGCDLRIEASRFLVSDATSLDLPDDQFDLIFSEDVFEHIATPSLEALVPRMAKWLKPDGLALISPNVFTGILGGHLSEWSYPSVLDPTVKRKSAPWEHLRARRFPPNTFLNELGRSQYRELLAQEFAIVEEVVLLPDLGREYLTGDVARDLSGYPEEELFSNKVLFVLRPNKGKSLSLARSAFPELR
jgi:SAM-dependent methyltransferase